MAGDRAIIGVSDHGGWAILVTATRDGALLDHRRVELVDDALPAIPHHHEAQRLPIDEGVALVETVRASADRFAAFALEAVARDVAQVCGIALRVCQPLPPTVAECITDYRARNVADWVMYRQALASAAIARGWTVHWFDAKTVCEAAGHSLGIDDFDTHFAQMRNIVGPPWNNDHKIALAAAIVAAREAP